MDADEMHAHEEIADDDDMDAEESDDDESMHANDADELATVLTMRWMLMR